jgi:hypothetical protein
MHLENFKYCNSHDSLFTNPKIRNLALNISECIPTTLLQLPLKELHLYNLNPGTEHKQLPSYCNDGFDIDFVDFDESRVPGNPQEQLKDLGAFSDQVKSL